MLAVWLSRAASESLLTGGTRANGPVNAISRRRHRSSRSRAEYIAIAAQNADSQARAKPGQPGYFAHSPPGGDEHSGSATGQVHQYTRLRAHSARHSFDAQGHA